MIYIVLNFIHLKFQPLLKLKEKELVVYRTVLKRV